ncbi:MAG: hypothetical protein JW708_10860 [Vallitaleaceae bacterium]|nr:hypothetical protein [Vallitaleaceae bacterium]
MKKKIIPLLLIATLALALILGYQFFFAPETSQGSKEVTLQIIAEEAGIDKSFTFKTDTELLFDLLKENEEELQLVYEEYDFGPMVTGFLGYQADAAKQEYYHSLVNGTDAATGPIEIPVTDGDTYVFEIRSW